MGKFKVKGQFQGQIQIFQLMKLRTSVIHHFHMILTGQLISENIIFISSRSSSRSKGQLQGQVRKRHVSLTLSSPSFFNEI